jgi:HlyD family secretion protein
MSTKAKKKKSRKGFWFFMILLLLFAAVVGFAFYKKSQEPKGVPVEFDTVKKRTIDEKVSASGRIFPEKEVKISSDVSGEIVELYVMEGDSVRAGQLLAKIDPEAYVSAVQRGEANVSGARAQLAVTKSTRESSIAQKEQIQSQLSNAQKILDRNKQLLTDGIISQADYDQASTSVDNLKANLRAAEASIRSAEENIKGSEFSIESAQATLKELKTNLGRTTIKAPVGGIVSSLSVEQGERVVGTIQMTGTEMMRVANLNSMEVQVDVSENDIVRVKLGDKVDVEVDAYLDEKIRGTVSEIANSASNIAGAAASLNTDQVTNFAVKIRLDADSYKKLVTPKQKYPFRPGMSASVDIYTNQAKDVITIPIQAVTAKEIDKDDDKKETEKSDEEFEEIVFVHSADTVDMRVIKTGIQDDEFIQVLSGLELDEEIVKGPYSAVATKLKQGSEVTKKKERKKKKD